MIIGLDNLDKVFMCYYDGMLYHPSSLSTLLNEASYNDMNQLQDIKWLMWSGFKDVDEELVFEGDICLFDDKHVGVVRFDEGTFCTDTHSDFDPLYRMESIKRLGNFFLNPELQTDFQEVVEEWADEDDMSFDKFINKQKQRIADGDEDVMEIFKYYRNKK